MKYYCVRKRDLLPQNNSGVYLAENAVQAKRLWVKDHIGKPRSDHLHDSDIYGVTYLHAASATFEEIIQHKREEMK